MTSTSIRMAWCEKLLSKLYRQRHLPPGMHQRITIDIRGQQVYQERLDSITRRIVEKTNGLVRPEHIEFVEAKVK